MGEASRHGPRNLFYGALLRSLLSFSARGWPVRFYYSLPGISSAARPCVLWLGFIFYFRGIVSNPVYAGIGPFPGLITDEQWVRAAADSSTDSLSNTFGRFFLCFCDKARKRTRPRKDRNLCYRLTSQTSVRNARAVSGEDLLYQPFDADRRLY